MEYLLYAIVPMIAGLILYAIMGSAVKAPGRALATKFKSLGSMTGKSYEQIKSVVGPENSRSTKTLEDGKVVTVRQWIATGYHIVLLFDENDNFICISSETAV